MLTPQFSSFCRGLGIWVNCWAVNSIVGDRTLTWQSCSSTDIAPLDIDPPQNLEFRLVKAQCAQNACSLTFPVPTSVRVIGRFQLKMGDCSFAE